MELEEVFRKALFPFMNKSDSKEEVEKRTNEKLDNGQIVSSSPKSDRYTYDNKEDKIKERKAPVIVPYSLVIKSIAEKSGLGDAEDFQKRINAINRFYDNEEIRTNIQILGNKTKGESVGKLKNWDIFNDPKKSKDFWDRLANDFRKSLKSNNLKEFESEEELVKAMLDKNYVAEVYPEYKKIKQEAENAMKSFSKKGQKVPFKEFDKQMVDPFKNKTIDEVVEMNKKGVLANKNPRLGIINATKKFNLLKKIIDVLSNAKLNAALSLLLTPTPLYEPSYQEVRDRQLEEHYKRLGIQYKPTYDLEETEQPSDNQTE